MYPIVGQPIRVDFNLLGFFSLPYAERGKMQKNDNGENLSISTATAAADVNQTTIRLQVHRRVYAASS